jgi:hypothetical protein
MVIRIGSKEKKDIASIDNSITGQAVHRWLPLTQCIARYLMMKEFPAVPESLSEKRNLSGWWQYSETRAGGCA